MRAPRIDFNTVYWVEDPTRLSVPAPTIAGNVEYFDERPELRFRDTQRPHQRFVRFEKGELTTGARFVGKDGSSLTLRLLDLATFERVFRALTNNAPKFTSDAELQAFYKRIVNTDAV